MVVRMKVHGADISHHNPDPDLKRAKAAGLLWLYHKATEGATVKDAKYGARRKAARAAGVTFGAYHFARPDGGDAVKEAQYFIAYADPQPGDLVPVLDFEVKYDNAEAWCKAFMKEVERLLRLRGLDGKPMHYGPHDFGPDYAYRRWVPRYNDSNTPPKVPYHIWQFSNGVLGVPDSFPGLGHVDLNNMRDGMTLAHMRLTKKAVTTPTKPPVTTPPKPPVVAPPVKPPVVAAKPKVVLSVGTANIQNFNPDLTDAQVRADLLKIAKKNLDVILLQEIGEQSDMTAVMQVFEKYDADYAVTNFKVTGAKSNPIVWEQGAPIKAKTGAELIKIGEGYGPGSHVPDNYVTRKIFTSGVAGIPDIEIINLHFIQGAYSKPGQPGDADGTRKRKWEINFANTKKLVVAGQAAGRIVIVGGDWNRTGGTIPAFVTGQKWIVKTDKGIDHIALVLPKGYTATVDGAPEIVSLQSDHDLRYNKVTISKV